MGEDYDKYVTLCESLIDYLNITPDEYYRVHRDSMKVYGSNIKFEHIDVGELIERYINGYDNVVTDDEWMELPYFSNWVYHIRTIREIHDDFVAKYTGDPKVIQGLEVEHIGNIIGCYYHGYLTSLRDHDTRYLDQMEYSCGYVIVILFPKVEDTRTVGIEYAKCTPLRPYRACICDRDQLPLYRQTDNYIRSRLKQAGYRHANRDLILNDIRELRTSYQLDKQEIRTLHRRCARNDELHIKLCRLIDMADDWNIALCSRPELSIDISHAISSTRTVMNRVIDMLKNQSSTAPLSVESNQS